MCAVGALRSDDYALVAKAAAIGAPIGYWIGETRCRVSMLRIGRLPVVT